MAEEDMKVKELGEFSLIERLVEVLGASARGTGQGVIRGIGDDAAVLQGTAGHRLLVSCDMLLEGVHFNWDFVSPEQLGWRALAANLSDIAAMGGRPRWVLVSLGLPGDTPVKKVEGIYRGISLLANEFGVTIVGGDTTNSPRGIVLDITVLGEALRNMVAYRSSAREGDLILVTGELGRSAAGLACLQQKVNPDDSVKEVAQAYLTPCPRVREAALLMRSGLVRALNDISDGLASETNEIAAASGLGAVLVEKRIPLGSATKNVAGILDHDPLHWALFGGEDFELLLTIPGGKGAAAQVRQLKRTLQRTCGTPLSVIGRMVRADEGIKLEKKGRKAEKLIGRGYEHF